MFFKSYILSGSYHNFFKSFCRGTRQENMFECSRENAKPKQVLKPKRIINSSNQNITGNILPSVQNNNKRNKKDEINVDSLDFSKKILHTSWHPKENIIAIAATNNLYIFHGKEGFSNFNESPSLPSSNGVNVLQTTQSYSVSS
jgi:serine/threonine-protein phosphatase 2A regulatory subunit B